jgi:protein phosphatase
MRDDQDAGRAFQTGAATHVGLVRRENEDSLAARPEAGLWAVSDGMGGHQAGAFASATIVEALSAIAPAPTCADLLNAVNDALERANGSIRHYASHNGASVVGATLAALLIFGKRFACVWCGDSRVYLIRDGKIILLTHDHSQVQDMIDQGALTEEEARSWPGRNVLTRAIGVFDAPETDLVEGGLLPDDIFVLCSDGLTGHVADGEILKIASRRPAASGCQDLIDLALERGGKDNVTVLVVQYKPDATRPWRPRALAPQGTG